MGRGGGFTLGEIPQKILFFSQALPNTSANDVHDFNDDMMVLTKLVVVTVVAFAPVNLFAL